MSNFIKKNLTIILSFFLIPSISKANNLNTEKNIILNKNENESNKENNVNVTNLKFPVRKYKKIYDDLIVGTLGLIIFLLWPTVLRKINECVKDTILAKYINNNCDLQIKKFKKLISKFYY